MSLSKSPVSYLQELTQRRQIENPVYIDAMRPASAIGNSHPFGCSVSMRGIAGKGKKCAENILTNFIKKNTAIILEPLQAWGFGTSKKQAKHNAAKELIEMITGKPFVTSVTPNSLDSSSSSGSSNGLQVDDLSINRLQEYAIGNRLPPPRYLNDVVTGPDNDRSFQITCAVGQLYQSAGFGKTKKSAKKDAAHKVLLLILGM